MMQNRGEVRKWRNLMKQEAAEISGGGGGGRRMGKNLNEV
jgi:hypothetical protein